MADYTLWTGLFDAWKATSDWIKALAILAPPGFALAALTLVLRHRAGVTAGTAAPNAPQTLPPAARLPDEIDRFVAEEDEDLRRRQQEARRALLLEPPLIDPETTDILQELRAIILENYRASHPPEAALQHIRRYLADRTAPPGGA